MPENSAITTTMNELTTRNAYWIIYRYYEEGMCLPMDDILGHMNVSNKYI